jgi:hypothetical protein
MMGRSGLERKDYCILYLEVVQKRKKILAKLAPAYRHLHGGMLFFADIAI